MRSPASKIALALAAADFTAAELRTFGRWIEDVGSREFVRRVEAIRAVAENVESSRASKNLAEDIDNVSLDVIRRIQRLLIQETKMSKSQASDELRNLMVLEGALPNDFPGWKGGPLEVWLNRLIKYSSASAALHFATRVSRRNVGGSGSDWPLTPQDE